MRPSVQFFVPASLLAATVIFVACTTSAAPNDGAGDPSPTPIPSALRGLGPATYEIPPTPLPLTPARAAEAGRTDCPQDWAGYEDPDGYFSLCYPADWLATSSLPQAYFGYTFSLRSPDDSRELTDSVQMVIYWEETSPSAAGVVNEPCGAEVFLEDVEELSVMLAGRAVSACVGDPIDTEGDNPGPPFYRRTLAEIPLGPDEGYVRLSFSERKDIGQSHAGLLTGILDSLQVGQ